MNKRNPALSPATVTAQIRRWRRLASIQRDAGRGFFRGSTADAACDALIQHVPVAEDQTVLDWPTAAGKRLGVSTAECVGA